MEVEDFNIAAEGLTSEFNDFAESLIAETEHPAAEVEETSSAFSTVWRLPERRAAAGDTFLGEFRQWLRFNAGDRTWELLELIWPGG